jgi:hypothetical protein
MGRMSASLVLDSIKPSSLLRCQQVQTNLALQLNGISDLQNTAHLGYLHPCPFSESQRSAGHLLSIAWWTPLETHSHTISKPLHTG